jgi:hypothetical protein
MILGIIVACGSDGTSGTEGPAGADGADGNAALVNVVSGETEDCENGGVLVEYGLDADGDEKLDESEITGTKSVCNGADGMTGVTGMTGMTGMTGLNGMNGLNGPNGIDGTNGMNGADGADGEDGHNALAASTPEDAGPHCVAGGQKLEMGIDLDDSGTLDPAEILTTTYICNGVDGADGHNSLIAATVEGSGSNCSAGGKRVDSGVDDNDDGLLDAAEIDDTHYVCHGTDGADGKDGVDGTNGTSGHNSLVAVVTESAGPNCTAGGKQITSGIDDDDNGVLDAAEIDDTSYVCNGTNGENGLNAVVTTEDEPPGSNCNLGGIKVTSGIDDSGEGVLDPGEIDNTSYICGIGGLWGATVPDFSGEIGPEFDGWTQCEGYYDQAWTEDIPLNWADDCRHNLHLRTKLVCGTSPTSYRYIDLTRNLFAVAMISTVEFEVIVESKDQDGNDFLTSRLVHTNNIHVDLGTSRWGDMDWIDETAPTLLMVDFDHEFEAFNCFGQNLRNTNRYLWVYVQ